MGDLGKLIVAKGFKKLPKVQKNRPIWSHCCRASVFYRGWVNIFFIIFELFRSFLKKDEKTKKRSERIFLPMLGTFQASERNFATERDSA